MTVRAKFKCNSITITEGSREVKNERGERTGWEPTEMKTITLIPVYSQDPNSENRKFWEASPSGELRLGTINQAASDQFKIGKEYYLDITPVE